MDKYNIDSHKLHLHPVRVAEWLRGETIYPLYVEFSPAGMCNHRCVFCTMDFMGYQSRRLDPDVYAERIREMGAKGVRAVMFGGEGEPLLNKDVTGMGEATKAAGIDLSITTNGVLLDGERVERLLPVTSWIKVSCNAGTPKSYARVHQTDVKDFSRVMTNLERAVKIRDQAGLPCTLGGQCILLPETRDDMVGLAQRMRDMGMDYLVIKPYTRHPQSLSNAYDEISYAESQSLVKELAAEERDGFKIVYREKAMDRWDDKSAAFEHCMALPFWAYVDAGGNVWGCSRHLSEEAFHYGNIGEQSFEDIWTGEKRQKGIEWCEEHLDVTGCHVTCRMEVINNYLWRLRHPQPHDNFI